MVRTKISSSTSLTTIDLDDASITISLWLHRTQTTQGIRLLQIMRLSPQTSRREWCQVGGISGSTDEDVRCCGVWSFVCCYRWVACAVIVASTVSCCINLILYHPTQHVCSQTIKQQHTVKTPTSKPSAPPVITYPPPHSNDSVLPSLTNTNMP